MTPLAPNGIALDRRHFLGSAAGLSFADLCERLVQLHNSALARAFRQLPDCGAARSKVHLHRFQSTHASLSN